MLLVTSTCCFFFDILYGNLENVDDPLDDPLAGFSRDAHIFVDDFLNVLFNRKGGLTVYSLIEHLLDVLNQTTV